MSWVKEYFGTDKPIIAMCHFRSLIGDPLFAKDAGGSMQRVVDVARADLKALQNGGVDAVMFSNEFSLPYLTDVEPVTVAAMAYVIGELKKDITIPFGVNVLWDPIASLDLAAATGARFIREIISGVYASDFGLWNTNVGKVARHRQRLGIDDVKMLFNIVPEAAKYLQDRDIAQIAGTTEFNCLPDALCVSGLTAGVETDSQVIVQVKNSLKNNTPVFCNTGVRLENVDKQLAVADGAVVGTTFKDGGIFFNTVDEARVHEFMGKVRQIRGDK